MATTASPYGLVPVKNADGSAYNGARDAFPILSSTGNIGYGTVVFLNAGLVNLSVKSGSANDGNNFGAATNIGALGVFVGCEYINSEGQLIFSQYFPTGTSGATAYVVTDPGVTFQAQAAGAVASTTRGLNVHFSTDQASGKTNTTTGKSTMALAAAETTDCAFKIVGFSDRGESVAGDTATDLLVKFNPNYHSMMNATVGSNA